MLSGLTITVYTDAVSMAIGNQFDSEQLAYYKKGMMFPRLIVTNVLSALNTALFPIMAKHDDIEETKALVRKCNQMSAFIITPLMFGLAAVTPSFITILLTDKWQPAAIFLQIYCLNFAIQPIAYSSLLYLQSSGRSREYFTMDILRKAVSISLLVLALIFDLGVIWIALTEVIGNFLAIFINMRPGKKYLNYKIWQQIVDVAPKIIASLVMFFIVYSINFIPLSPVLKIIIQVIVGIAIYLILSKYIIRMKEIDLILDGAKKHIKFKTKK